MSWGAADAGGQGGVVIEPRTALALLVKGNIFGVVNADASVVGLQ
jgi:hypothetical protein